MIIVRVIVVLLILISNASYGSKSYFSLVSGLAMPVDASVGLTGYIDGEVEYDSAMTFGLSVGVEIEEGTKLEALYTSQENEGTIQQLDISLVAAGLSPLLDLEMNTFGLNLIQNIDKFRNEKLSLFYNIGAGVGFAKVSGSDLSAKDTEAYFNAGGGIIYDLGEGLNINLKYNYYFMGHAEDGYAINVNGTITEIKTDLDLGMHQWLIGVSKSL